MARREKYDTFWLQTEVAAAFWELRTLAQPENALYYIWASHRLTRKSVLHPVLHLGLTPPHTQAGAPFMEPRSLDRSKALANTTYIK